MAWRSTASQLAADAAGGAVLDVLRGPLRVVTPLARPSKVPGLSPD